MRPAFRRSLVILCLALLAPVRGHSLADNVVRVDRFNWMKVETEHFDIYYDKKTEPLIPQMAVEVENAWKEVGDRFGYSVPKRTPFFFFSDHNRFEQTNVVNIGEGTGGVTEAFNPADEAYGVERLVAEIRAHRAGTTEALVDRICSSVTDFAGAAPQSDDITLTALKWGPQ